jgi:hypothetical protein
MSRYLPAFAVLLLAVLVGVKGALSSVTRLGSLRAGIADASRQIALGQSSVAVREQWLLAEARVSDLGEFDRSWGPEIDRLRDLSAITQRVNAEAEGLQLPVQEQRTEDPRANALPKGASVPPGTSVALRYSVAVTGDLISALRWLGRVEEVLPLARAERVELTPSQDWVVLRCTLAIPDVGEHTP